MNSRESLSACTTNGWFIESVRSPSARQTYVDESNQYQYVSFKHTTSQLPYPYRLNVALRSTERMITHCKLVTDSLSCLDGRTYPIFFEHHSKAPCPAVTMSAHFPCTPISAVDDESMRGLEHCTYSSSFFLSFPLSAPFSSPHCSSSLPSGSRIPCRA